MATLMKERNQRRLAPLVEPPKARPPVATPAEAKARQEKVKKALKEAVKAQKAQKEEKEPSPLNEDNRSTLAYGVGATLALSSLAALTVAYALGAIFSGVGLLPFLIAAEATALALTAYSGISSWLRMKKVQDL